MSCERLQLHTQKPPSFNPKMHAAACYLEIDGHLLFIEQGKDKYDAGYWGVPGGKLEPGETPLEAAQRELLEETGIELLSSELKSIGTLYIRNNDFEYAYYMFQVELDQKPLVHLSPDHSDYRWVNAEDLKILPLRGAGIQILDYYWNRSIDPPSFS